MAGEAPPDPFAFFRDMVSQWEKVANDVGTQIAARPEFAQGMQGATAAGLKVQQAANEAMAKGLAAANMPSKGDVDALAARLTAIEAQLARIEATLNGAPKVEAAPPPRPKRTKQPPPKQ